MNIDATEADLHAAAECLKLAAILDDRAPKADKARILAWGEKIHTHALEREDLLNGLQAFYDTPQDRAIGIGDLLQHGKIARRDRTEREDAAAMVDRRSEQDRKAATEETRSVLSGFVGGKVKHKTDRLIKAENGLQCAVDKRTAIEAIREFFAAKAEATRRPITTGGAR